MSRKSNAEERPTPMEAAVMGTIWQEAPCTAYFIRKKFLNSPSAKWSGSAGAIYPLLLRLEQLGLIRSEQRRGANRKQLDYTIEKKGKVVLRRWLRQVEPVSDTGLIHDPLRLKILFIDLLSRKQAQNFADSAIEEVRSQLELRLIDCENNSVSKDLGGGLAARNAYMLTHARLAWLEEVKSELDD